MLDDLSDKLKKTGRTVRFGASAANYIASKIDEVELEKNGAWAVARCVSNECEDFISEKLLEDAYCCNDCTVEVENGGTGALHCSAQYKRKLRSQNYEYFTLRHRIQIRFD